MIDNGQLKVFYLSKNDFVAFTTNSQLILLRSLFFLAARYSANKFALCSRSAASVLNSQLKFSLYLKCFAFAGDIGVFKNCFCFGQQRFFILVS